MSGFKDMENMKFKDIRSNFMNIIRRKKNAPDNAFEIKTKCH